MKICLKENYLSTSKYKACCCPFSVLSSRSDSTVDKANTFLVASHVIWKLVLELMSEGTYNREKLVTYLSLMLFLYKQRATLHLWICRAPVPRCSVSWNIVVRWLVTPDLIPSVSTKGEKLIKWQGNKFWLDKAHAVLCGE